MRVLLTTDSIGGVWIFSKELTQGLLARGHYVSLVNIGRPAGAEQIRWCERTFKLQDGRFQCETLDVPLEWMDDNHRSYHPADLSLLRTARAFRADIIHSSQFCFGALPVDVPKVVTAHSDVMSWWDACRSEPLHRSPWLDRYRALVCAGLRGADAIVAPTHWMAEALGRGFALAPHARVIGNGRTLDPPTSSVNREMQAVSVGRLWDEAKQIGMLHDLEAAMPLVVAGETMLGEADALCEEEVLALFRRSSVYVATSIYEPFGLAPLEAALCGCAVVANDIPSLREIWGNGAIYFRDRDSLRRVLNRLARSPRELRQAAQNSGRRALTFSATRMVEQYCSLYNELLGARGSPRLEMAEAYAG